MIFNKIFRFLFENATHTGGYLGMSTSNFKHLIVSTSLTSTTHTDIVEDHPAWKKRFYNSDLLTWRYRQSDNILYYWPSEYPNQSDVLDDVKKELGKRGLVVKGTRRILWDTPDFDRAHSN